MCCRKLLDVQTIGQDTIGFPLEKMLALVSSDMGDGGEDICGVGCRALYAVAMIYASLASLCIDVEPLQIVVEIDVAGAEVSTEKSGVCSEDGRAIYPPSLRQGQCYTC